VGVTSWTDARIITVERTIQATTLRGQNVSRRMPNGWTGDTSLMIDLPSIGTG
jgi:hypothetical protein